MCEVVGTGILEFGIERDKVAVEAEEEEEDEEEVTDGDDDDVVGSCIENPFGEDIQLGTGCTPLIYMTPEKNSIKIITNRESMYHQKQLDEH
jgi:hypothetical protein